MSRDITIILEPPLEFILKQGGRFRRELEDMTGLWERFSFVMERVEQELFDSEGHGAWPPLADSTVLEKAAMGYSDKMLVRTGDLMESLTDPTRAAAIFPLEMTWGTDVEYAHWHQDGGTIPGRPPKREILQLRVEDRRALEGEMVSWINEAAARTWGRV